MPAGKFFTICSIDEACTVNGAHLDHMINGDGASVLSMVHTTSLLVSSLFSLSLSKY